MADETADGIEIPIQWGDPGESPFIYPTNLVVQHTPEEFLIYFYAIEPPLLFGENEEAKRKQLLQLKTVQAKPLVKVIVTPGRMAEFVKIMTENLDNYRKRTVAASLTSGGRK